MFEVFRELLEGEVSDTYCPHCDADLIFSSEYYGEYLDTRCPECSNLISVDKFAVVEGE